MFKLPFIAVYALNNINCLITSSTNINFVRLIENKRQTAAYLMPISFETSSKESTRKSVSPPTKPRNGAFMSTIY